MFKCLQVLSYNNPIFIPILQTRKLKNGLTNLPKAPELANLYSVDLNPNNLTPAPMLLSSIEYRLGQRMKNGSEDML